MEISLSYLLVILLNLAMLIYFAYHFYVNFLKKDYSERSYDLRDSGSNKTAKMLMLVFSAIIIIVTLIFLLFPDVKIKLYTETYEKKLLIAFNQAFAQEGTNKPTPPTANKDLSAVINSILVCFGLGWFICLIGLLSLQEIDANKSKLAFIDFYLKTISGFFIGLLNPLLGVK